MNSSKTSDSRAEAEILRLVTERGPGKTICPTEAARALAREGEDFRRQLSGVRAAAISLVKAERLIITRKGKPVDPDDFRGVYRLGLPTD
jgi:hypothetical protein